MVTSIRAEIQTLFKSVGAQATAKDIKQITNEYNKLGKTSVSVAHGTRAVTGQLKKVDGQLKTTTKTVNTFRQRFNFAWLSVMFGGMAIQKAFQGIFDKGFKTFRDLAGETNFLNQQMERLKAATTLLKFTLGEALAGTLTENLPRIMAVIEAITDWIERNPALAASIVVWGLALGTAAVFLGQLMLLIGGLKLLGMGKIFTALDVAVGGFGLSLLGLIGGFILVIMWFKFLSDKIGGGVNVLKAIWNGFLRFWNLMVQSWLRSIEFIVEGIRWLASQVDKVLGTNMAGSIDRALMKMRDFRAGVGDFFRGLEFEIGTELVTANPFSGGAFQPSGGQTTNNTTVNVNGITALSSAELVGDETVGGVIDEVLRTQGATQTLTGEI